MNLLFGAGEPSVASQHMCGPIRWVVLTGSGAHMVQQLQPVDLLRQLLIDSQGADSPQVKAFFQVRIHPILLILIDFIPL